MSIQAVAWVLDQLIRDPWKKLIMISLANHADHTTGECWPSMRLIAKEASCRRETVQRKLPELETDGLIQIIKADKGDRRRVHTYRLLMPGVCASHAHQIGPMDRASRSDLMCVPVTRGCDSAVTTKNHHMNHHTKSLSPSLEPRARKGLGNEGRPKSEHQSVVTARVANRLGRGDAQSGWLMLGALSDAMRDQLTAQERSGRLDDTALDEVRSKLREQASLPLPATSQMKFFNDVEK